MQRIKMGEKKILALSEAIPSMFKHFEEKVHSCVALNNTCKNNKVCSKKTIPAT